MHWRRCISIHNVTLTKYFEFTISNSQRVRKCFFKVSAKYKLYHGGGLCLDPTNWYLKTRVTTYTCIRSIAQILLTSALTLSMK